MFNKSISYDSTSTPKRRRLGTGGGSTSRPSLLPRKKFSPVCKKRADAFQNIIDRCESPPIPSNQYEFLADSSNSQSSTNFINQDALSFLNESIITEMKEENNEVKCKLRNNQSQQRKLLNQTNITQYEIENISDDMFHSKLEVDESFCNNHEEVLTLNSEKLFRDEVEQSFTAINQTITHLDDQNKDDKKLFEDNGNKAVTCNEIINKENSFYDLPLKAKSLFKSCRNIEKFYEWQEECLNLDAIKEKRNLIYALPTSGGKTLVAEVLMLREVLNRKKNALFILPFVAIVQEKIWSLSPFAVQLGFLVEEYAAGKGSIPPKKRRNKNSIYIGTIEKALMLIRSLIESERLDEIGLIVVDELHLIGEPGRGGTLETLLSTVIFANRGIQIVGMSATIGNLSELATYLEAEVYQRQFRPVELAEYVKLGSTLHRLRWSTDGELTLEPEREVKFDYSPAATALDPDGLGGLVAEVTPAGSCLVFCPTKKNCENVAELLYKMQRREMVEHRCREREALSRSLQGAGLLARCVRRGVAFHHAGLAADERAALEDAFRSGVVSVLCCTSTLAAGVNLPARRVLVRAPRVGARALSLAEYRQMAGRAGRATHCETGESIIICDPVQWAEFRGVLSGGLAPALSALAPRPGDGGPRGPGAEARRGPGAEARRGPGDARRGPGDAGRGPGDAGRRGTGAGELTLGAVALRLADTRARLRLMFRVTLLSVQADRLNVNIDQICDDSIRYLLTSGAIEVSNKHRTEHSDAETCLVAADGTYIYDDTVLVVSELGNATVKGGMELGATRLLLQDLQTASLGLVLTGPLHLLYLVTPQDAAGVRPDYRLYYELYCKLDEDSLRIANVLGITEKTAIKMITGKPITNVSETVLARFYVALILQDLYNEMDSTKVAEKYGVPRGGVSQALSLSASSAAAAARVCGAAAALWTHAAWLAELATRLRAAAAPGLRLLAQLPNVRRARALQLSLAGYSTVELVARASPEALTRQVPRLSWSAATHLVSAAKLMLIEKVENLRAEADEVMQDLNI